MSHQATFWAFRQKLPALQKLVLVVLADRHNSDTGRCDPSLAKVAEDCGMSKNSVKAAIKGLEEKGLISAIARKDGPANLSNFYTFNFEEKWGDTPSGARGAPGVGHVAPQGGAPAGPKPVIEPGIEPVSTPVELPFDGPPASSTPEEKSTWVKRIIRERTFPYYLQTCRADGNGLYSLTDKRLKQGFARFREALRMTKGDWRKAELLMECAIDTMAASKFHMGDNDRHQKYNDWELLFRSAEKFEWWLAKSEEE